MKMYCVRKQNFKPISNFFSEVQYDLSQKQCRGFREETGSILI